VDVEYESTPSSTWGLLPPWTDWWDEDISALFPSPEVREQVERDRPRLASQEYAGRASAHAYRPCSG